MAARILGISWFDTAEQYGGGKSEAQIGKWGQWGEVVTKVGLLGDHSADDTSRWNDEYSPARLSPHFQDSLLRLRRKSVYALLLHCPTAGTDFKRHVEELLKLKDLGLVRKIGISADALLQIPDSTDWIEVVETPVSLLSEMENLSAKTFIVNGVFQASNGLNIVRDFIHLKPDVTVIVLIGTTKLRRVFTSFMRFQQVVIKPFGK